MSNEDIAVVRKGVSTMLDSCFVAMRQRGLEAELDFIENSDQFFWVPPGSDTPWSFYAVFLHVTQNSPRFRSVTNRVDSLIVVPHSLQLASYSVQITSETVDTAGVSRAVKLRESGTVVRRKNEGWKYLCGQTRVIGNQ